MHPVPADRTVPITSRFTPNGDLTLNLSMMSSTLKERLNTPVNAVCVFDCISCVFSETGTIFFATSEWMPRVKAKLGVGSASMARTLKPSSARK